MYVIFFSALPLAVTRTDIDNRLTDNLTYFCLQTFGYKMDTTEPTMQAFQQAHYVKTTL